MKAIDILFAVLWTILAIGSAIVEWQPHRITLTVMCLLIVHFYIQEARR